MPTARLPLLQEVYRRIRAVTRPCEVPAPAVRRLALLVTGIIGARSCVLRQVAAELDSLGATSAGAAEHVERRLRRALNDPQLTAEACFDAALRASLDWTAVLRGTRRVVLALDDSSQDDRVHLLRLSVSYWGGSLPLVWATWEQNIAQPDGHYWAMVDGLFDRVAALLPAGVDVVVTADRAFSVAAFVDRVAARGWQWEASRVRGVQRQRRLLLGMAWASLLVLCLGLTEAQQRLASAARPPTPGRRPPKPQPARDSLFSLGLRAARRWLYRRASLPLSWRLTDFDPLSWQTRWRAAQGRRYIFHSVRP